MFKFRLQRVLELRVQREQVAAGQLADAQRDEERAENALRALERLRDEGARRLSSAPGAPSTAGQLQNFRYVVDRLEQEVQAARHQVTAAQAQVERRTEEFNGAFRDRRVLDRLRERDLLEWQLREQQADRQLMDGIALNRFVRASSTAKAEEGEG